MVRIILLSLLLLLTPTSGQAEGSFDKATFDEAGDFYCPAEGDPNPEEQYTKLYKIEACETPDLKHVFSGFVCKYEEVLSKIFGRMYCGAQTASKTTISVVMTLFVAILGVGVLMQIVPFTASQMMLALLKIALVVGFATNAGLMIGILYRGLMYFSQESINVILAQLGGITLSEENGVLKTLDAQIGGFFNADGTSDISAPCAKAFFPLIATLFVAVPPVALIGIMMVFRLFMVLIQTVFGYLAAITGIMFMLILSPIFLSFALFKQTQSLFNKWVQYLLSFSLQIAIVMAFVGVVLSMKVGDDVGSLGGIITNYSTARQVDSMIVESQDTCTICKGKVQDGKYVCEKGTDGKPIPLAPDALVNQGDFWSFLGTEVAYLFILASILEAALKAAPEIAKALTATNQGPTIGSDGLGGIGNTLDLVGKRFSQGFNDSGGALPSKAIGGAKEAAKGIMGTGIADGFKALLGIR